MKNLQILLVVFLGVTSCGDTDSTGLDLLLEPEGWYAYEYSRVETGKTAHFVENAPYIILGEYGNSIALQPNGVCRILYTDGTAPVGTGVLELNWKMDKENRLHFTNASEETIEADIIQFEPGALWIRYFAFGDTWEYRLKPYGI